VAGAKPAPFNRSDALKPDVMKVVLDALEKGHPTAKGAFAKARGGQFEGTAMLAMDAGDQAAAAVLRGLELFSKGQLDQAATQFGVALRSSGDSSLASFYLGACFAAAGKDREAVAAWQRAANAQLPLPNLPQLLAEGYLRMGQAAQAVGPLKDALTREPGNDAVRKNLAVALSQMGQHDQAYETIRPYLDKNANDLDALMVALVALYQTHVEGKTLGTAAEDKAQAAVYARAYIAGKGPAQALVEKWAEYLSH
jgi:tetratricopeptide (TPR) repeat protein